MTTPLSTLRTLYTLGRSYRALPQDANVERDALRKEAHRKLVAAGCRLSITEKVNLVRRIFDGKQKGTRGGRQ